MDFSKELEAKVTSINERIYAFLPKEEGYQKTIFEAMRYSILAGGKRLRPMLMEETYKLFGGQEKSSNLLWQRSEMIHTYSLVHDDLPGNG